MIMKNYGTAVILLFFLVNVVNGQSDIGGTTAPDGKYPYQAAVKNNFKFFCGASIINEHWLLTAAHCAERILDPVNATVLVGTNKRDNGTGTEYKVIRALKHEDYSVRYTHSDDIGLIQVAESIKFNEKVQPIKLPKDNNTKYEGRTAVLAGWGIFEKDTPAPEDLQHVQLYVYNFKKCVKEWKTQRNRTVTESQLCTTGKTEQNMATKGDSGGPLVSNGEQIGVVSFAWPNLPDIHTKVAYYLPWINAHTKDK